MTECQKCSGKAQLYLCPLCITELRQQLLRLPTLASWLMDSAVGDVCLGTNGKGSHTNSYESPALLGDRRATKLVDQILATVGGWARGIARQYGIMISPPVTWRRPWDTYSFGLTDYANFLAAHCDLLAKDPEIGELCSALRRYSKRGLAIVNRPVEPQFCGPCPATITKHDKCEECGGRDHDCGARLLAPRGAVEVTCGDCGALHRVERLVTTLLARADHYRATIPELYRVLRMLDEPVPLRTLYRWAEPKTSNRGSGQLRAAGYLSADKRRIVLTRKDNRDTPVYRVSDARKRRLENRKEKEETAK